MCRRWQGRMGQVFDLDRLLGWLRVASVVASEDAPGPEVAAANYSIASSWMTLR